MRSHFTGFCIGGWDITIYAGVPFLLVLSGSSWYALGAGGSALRWKKIYALGDFDVPGCTCFRFLLWFG
jgi:hypothetical protein